MQIPDGLEEESILGTERTSQVHVPRRTEGSRERLVRMGLSTQVWLRIGLDLMVWQTLRHTPSHPPFRKTEPQLIQAVGGDSLITVRTDHRPRRCIIIGWLILTPIKYKRKNARALLGKIRFPDETSALKRRELLPCLSCPDRCDCVAPWSSGIGDNRNDTKAPC